MSNSVYNLDMANLEYIQKLIGSAVDNMRLAKSKAYEAYDFIARDNRLLNSYSKKYNLSLYSKFSADSTTTSSITSILTPCIEDCESVIAAFDYFKNIDETGAVSEEL
ncbi:MAG: hypothetical protein IJO27_00640, partial [Bacilli bacterium]|nr:hypothetical protein [Bacilli bacterium]